MKKVITLNAAFVAISFVFPAASQASLIGQTIDATGRDWFVGGSGNPTTVSALVVDPGVEFFGVIGFQTDVEDAAITMFLPSGAQNAGGAGSFPVTFDELSWGSTPGSIVGVNVSTTGVVPTNIENTVTFTENSVSFAAGGSWNSISEVASLRIDLIVEHASPAPEPSSIVLAGMALAGLFGFRRRRRR